ncbi:MAG: hypothetical protein AMXMBFR4_24840 [Candidatus Hydrogenedentota bacterium]
MSPPPLFGPGIVDCNVFIGNYAFRRLRRNDATSVVAMMDRFGVDLACAASADAILYRDCQAGNEKLYEDTRAYADRFHLYATINPAYAGWQRDLARCVDLGFKAVRLYPLHHGYSLSDPAGLAVIDAATEAGLPVSLPCRVEDVRQRHWMDIVDNLDPVFVLSVAEQRPKASYLLTESILGFPRESDLWKRMHALGFHVEHSRMTSVLEKSIEVMVGALGPDRVLFGTGFPFKTPSPAFLKLQLLDSDAEIKEQIAGGNALRLFGLIPSTNPPQPAV